jgi:tetratricopeptide (TPR) repeat protein
MSVIRVSLAVFGDQALEDEPATAPLAGAAELTEAERRSSQSGQRADEAARSEASVRFRTGVNLYLEGDFQGAMAEFQRAYASMPSALVLYNLAQTHLALRDYVAARDTLLRYVKMEGDGIPPDRRIEIEAQLATLSRRIGAVRIACNEDGAKVMVDGHLVGQTPLKQPIPVSSGQHRIEIQATGRVPEERQIVVAGETEVTVSIDLPAPPPPAVAIQARPPEEPRRRLRIAGFTGIGVGIGGGVAAGALFALAMNARSDYEAATSTAAADVQRANAARDDFHRLSLAADLLTGVSVAVGGVGLVLTLVDRRKHQNDRTQRSLDVSVAPTGALSLRGRF